VRPDDESGVTAGRHILLFDHEFMDSGQPGQVGDDSEWDEIRTTERKLMAAVLIVDDSAADRALLRTVLGRAGYTVYEVAKGREAVRKARDVRPHIVILDVNLPDLSGLEVCRAIRADSEIAGVPVLMLTVRHDDSDVLAGLEAGADDYVAKDSAGEIILGRVRRLIQFRQMSSMAMLNQQLIQVGRLLAGIVHEIRGPLSVIQGSAEVLQLNGQETAENRQWVDAILRNTQVLQLRLDHLMAAVRNSSSDVQVVNLCSLLEESAQLFVKGLPTSKRRIQVHTACEEPVPPIRVDPGRLMQVLFNLLGNAEQALSSSPTGGRILLRSGTVEEEGGRLVTVQVIDDGPGVPEAFIDRIFEPFFTTREDGTGYGLYLAAEILREQSGRLTVRNNPEGGATFTISFPAVEQPGTTPPAAGRSR
jgi:signal transduction histidine kinase